MFIAKGHYYKCNFSSIYTIKIPIRHKNKGEICKFDGNNWTVYLKWNGLMMSIVEHWVCALNLYAQHCNLWEDNYVHLNFRKIMTFNNNYRYFYYLD